MEILNNIVIKFSELTRFCGDEICSMLTVCTMILLSIFSIYGIIRIMKKILVLEISRIKKIKDYKKEFIKIYEKSNKQEKLNQRLDRLDVFMQIQNFTETKNRNIIISMMLMIVGILFESIFIVFSIFLILFTLVHFQKEYENINYMLNEQNIKYGKKLK